MATNLRAVCVLLFFTTFTGISCGTQDTVTIPASDTTPPTVVMDIHFSQNRIYTVTSSGFNPTMPTNVGANDEISLIARGDDHDGGIQDIQLWIDITKTTCDPATGLCSTAGPGLAGAPTASNADTAKQPGETALQTRLVSHTLNIQQLRGSATSIMIEIEARAVNFQGVSVNTVSVTLNWP